MLGNSNYRSRQNRFRGRVHCTGCSVAAQSDGSAPGAPANEALENSDVSSTGDGEGVESADHAAEQAAANQDAAEQAAANQDAAEQAAALLLVDPVDAVTPEASHASAPGEEGDEESLEHGNTSSQSDSDDLDDAHLPEEVSDTTNAGGEQCGVLAARAAR